MRRLPAIVLFMVVSGAVNAGGYGVGIQSCAQFAKSYAENPTIAEDLYFAWAEGFMSGLNIVNEANNLPFRALDNANIDGQKAQIRSYCDAHPLAQYVGAVIAVYSNFPVVRPNSR